MSVPTLRSTPEFCHGSHLNRTSCILAAFWQLIVLDGAGGVNGMNDAGQIIGSRANQAVLWTLPVATPTALLAQLRTYIHGLPLSHGTRQALLSYLRIAEQLLEKGKPHAAAQVLRAFTATVKALPSKEVSPPARPMLVDKAREISALLASKLEGL